MLLVLPVDHTSQNTHFRLPSEISTQFIYELLVVGGSGVGCWGYWPGILEAVFWLPRKHPETKPPFPAIALFQLHHVDVIVVSFPVSVFCSRE